jgi:hypothetical protein
MASSNGVQQWRASIFRHLRASLAARCLGPAFCPVPRLRTGATLVGCPFHDRIAATRVIDGNSGYLVLFLERWNRGTDGDSTQGLISDARCLRFWNADGPAWWQSLRGSGVESGDDDLGWIRSLARSWSPGPALPEVAKHHPQKLHHQAMPRFPPQLQPASYCSST